MTLTTDRAGWVAEAIDEKREWWDRRRETIGLVLRYLGVRQQDLAEALGMTRQALNARLTGLTTIEPWELAGFAAAFGFGEEVLMLDPEDAIRWILDHPEVITRSRWSSPSSQRKGTAA